MKKIERPDLNGWEDWHKELFDEFWIDQIEPHNKLIEDAVELYGYHTGKPHGQWLFGEKKAIDDDTHRAYLIGIEPIKKETKEEACKRLLRDWVKCAPLAKLSRNEVDIFLEAKALLGDE